MTSQPGFIHYATDGVLGMSNGGRKRQRDDADSHKPLGPAPSKRAALSPFPPHKLPRSFGTGTKYQETRKAHRLAIQSLSERDARQEPFWPGEDLHFLTRSKSYSQDLVEPGTNRSHVSIEPQYKSGSLTGIEQKDHRKSQVQSGHNLYRGSYPDWVGRKFDSAGPEVAFDLKVPYVYRAAKYLSTYEKDTRREFDNRRLHAPPGTEQRLVIDLNSAGHDAGRKSAQHAEVAAYIEAYKANEKRVGRSPNFYADSIQYIYRGKHGALKASKPYYVNPITVHHPVPKGYSKDGASSKVQWFGNAGSVSSFSRRPGFS